MKLPLEMVKPSNRQVRFSGETLNISSSGVLFEADTADTSLDEGEAIEYYITLPTSPSPVERLRLHCIGKIMRVAPAEASGRFSVAATMERYEFTRQRMATGSPLAR